ncbi:unnamed protein product [Aureobasidium vineae]|uniref:Cryptic loci regulator 2 N-terminal domain-containing protein n=1 Tax=Aureobasidium vineae TaxID=2773715 RepID=A0A9N8JJU1_9PEZI|nr:unnamed protein product [Aureobasidium vineae]
MAKVDPKSSAPISKIDLSDPMYHSDGVPGHQSRDMTREDDASFLDCLSKAFNNTPRLFINKPPRDYASFIRPETYDDGQRVDKFIYGHPSGMSYASLTSFAEHVLSIIKGELDNCTCVNCQGVPVPQPRADS